MGGGIKLESEKKDSIFIFNLYTYDKHEKKKEMRIPETVFEQD